MKKTVAFLIAFMILTQISVFAQGANMGNVTLLSENLNGTFPTATLLRSGTWFMSKADGTISKNGTETGRATIQLKDVYGATTFKDIIIETRIQIQSTYSASQLEIEIRNPSNPANRISIWLKKTQAQLVLNNSTEIVGSKEFGTISGFGNSELSSDKWYDVKVLYSGSSVQTYIKESTQAAYFPVFDVIDDRASISLSGRETYISAGPNAQFSIDDIQVSKPIITPTIAYSTTLNEDFTNTDFTNKFLRSGSWFVQKTSSIGKNSTDLASRTIITVCENQQSLLVDDVIMESQIQMDSSTTSSGSLEFGLTLPTVNLSGGSDNRVAVWIRSTKALVAYYNATGVLSTPFSGINYTALPTTFTQMLNSGSLDSTKLYDIKVVWTANTVSAYIKESTQSNYFMLFENVALSSTNLPNTGRKVFFEQGSSAMYDLHSYSLSEKASFYVATTNMTRTIGEIPSAIIQTTNTTGNTINPMYLLGIYDKDTLIDCALSTAPIESQSDNILTTLTANQPILVGQTTKVFLWNEHLTPID